MQCSDGGGAGGRGFCSPVRPPAHFWWSSHSVSCICDLIRRPGYLLCGYATQRVEGGQERPLSAAHLRTTALNIVLLWIIAIRKHNGGGWRDLKKWKQTIILDRFWAVNSLCLTACLPPLASQVQHLRLPLEVGGDRAAWHAPGRIVLEGETPSRPPQVQINVTAEKMSRRGFNSFGEAS